MNELLIVLYNFHIQIQVELVSNLIQFDLSIISSFPIWSEYSCLIFLKILAYRHKLRILQLCIYKIVLNRESEMWHFECPIVSIATFSSLFWFKDHPFYLAFRYGSQTKSDLPQ